MATMNPFDLLGDDEGDDPTQLLAKAAALAQKAEAKKAAPAAAGKGGAQTVAKLPTKPPPPAQAVSESRGGGAPTRGGYGGGYGRGERSSGRGGRGGYGQNRDFGSEDTNGYRGGYGARTGGEEGAQDREKAPRQPYQGGGRRGGFRDGEFGDDSERPPRRNYERHSGTGRGYEIKREGAGRGNWGTTSDEFLAQETEALKQDEKAPAPEKQGAPEDAPKADENKASKDGAAVVEEEKEEDNEMTLEEFEKVMEEKRKALLALKKSEERKVEIDKDLQAMQLLSTKKGNDEVFIKLGADKEALKKKENAEREERAKKASGARMKRPDRGDVIAGRSRNIEETQATKKMLKKRRLEGSSSAGFSHPNRDYVKKLRRGKLDDVACWASPPTDGWQMTSGRADGRRMWSAAVVPPPHAHPRTPAVPKDKPAWLSSGPHKSDMSQNQPKGMKELGVNGSSTCRTNQKVSQGVNRSSTLRRMPINRFRNAGLGLSGSLPCVPEETSRSGAGLFSTPLARKLAEDNNVQVSSVKGIPEIGENIDENLVKYSDKELTNVLSKWVNKGSYVLEDYVFDVDIYEATLPSLKKHSMDGIACFVLNLHEMKANAKGKIQYKRTTPDGRWRGVGFNPYDGGEFIKKKFTRTSQGCNLVMYEYTLKGGPQNKVLCKLEWESPEHKEEETTKHQFLIGNNDEFKETIVRDDLKNKELQLNAMEILEENFSTLKDKYSKLKDHCTVLKDNYTRSEDDRSTLKKQMKELQEYVSLLESSNKLLNNQILELKGNVRVFCRVRPFLSKDDSNGHEEGTISYPSSFENARRGIALMNKGQKEHFSYDKVFDHSASQDDVFVEISELVQSALDGYKVCIFAYGSTGSGKTYTMIGKPGHDQKGIIPRSLEQIFKTSQSLELGGWKYALQASMLEIYNETIRDLLAPGCSSSEMPRGKQYTIMHDSHGNTTVSNLTTINVLSTAEVMSLLEKASGNRSVCKTQLNDESSRSHFIFTLKIFGSNESTGQQVQGVLNFIDLAGTERLSESGATGNCAKETMAINKSLSALSQVITKIGNKKEDYVSFRCSKLTYLLQTCLGGQSKVLMFVNITPEASRAGETLCSLRFAKNVNNCELGVARRQASDDRTRSYG